MTYNLTSTGSIADQIYNSLAGLPTALSGTPLVQIAELALAHVSNYTGDTISSTGITATYGPAIYDFAMANLLDVLNAQPGGASISLGELSIDEKGAMLSAEQYRIFGEMKLKALGRKIRFARSLS
jgi:hypothetical protein